MCACDEGHVDVVNALLAHGADLNVKDVVRYWRLFQHTSWCTTHSFLFLSTCTYVCIISLYHFCALAYRKHSTLEKYDHANIFGIILHSIPLGRLPVHCFILHLNVIMLFKTVVFIIVITLAWSLPFISIITIWTSGWLLAIVFLVIVGRLHCLDDCNIDR